MNNRKLIYGIVLAVIFLFSIGMTYAYFSVTTNIEGEPNDILTSTGTLSILYVDGPEIKMLESHPGSYVAKTLTIKNTGSLDTGYYINWSSLTNNIINDELIINLSCVEYSTYISAGSEQNELVGSCGYTTLPIGASIGEALVDNVPLAVGYTHVYDVRVGFIETGSNQNYNQNKTFAGVLMVDGASMRLTSLRGVLMNGDTPMPNVTMTTHSTPITTTTDENGEYFIDNIEYGVHELEIKDNEDNVIGTGSFELKHSNAYSSVVDNTHANWNSNETSYTKLNMHLQDNALDYLSIELETTPESCFDTIYSTTWTESSELFINDYYLSDSCGVDVIIPNEINGREVFGIDSNAFRSKGIKSVRFPPTVVGIGYYSFAGNELTSVTIPDGVIYLESQAFLSNQLTSVTIPSSVRSIGSSAFSYNKLTSVTIPNGVTSIEYRAFSDNELTSVTIPDSVRTIESDAFEDNKLTSVTIPSSVRSIGSSAFSNNKLKSVTIPNGVTSIGYQAFFNNKLTNVTIPDSVRSIGSSAFFNNKLTSVTIPDSVTSISGGAFNNNLLPNNQAFIYARTDSNSDGIAEIDYTTIVSYGGAQRSNVVIPSRAEDADVDLTIIGNYAFAYNQLTSVTIPNSVESIGWSAFEDNQLTSVTIEEKLSSAEFYQYSPSWGWSNDVSCIINNTSNVTNGCITWGAS